MKIKRSLAGLLAFSLVANADVGLLSKVIDGDTIYFNDVKCRLAYIDTPESKKNKKAIKDSQECTGITPLSMVDAGIAAANFTKSSLQQGKSYQYQVIDTDRYGRSVCEVASNGRLLNMEIVSQGYAVPYTNYIHDDEILRQFSKALSDAKRNNRGLWKTHPNVMKCLEEGKK